MYDITKRRTFIGLDSWHSTIKELVNKDEIIIGLIGNKMDLFENMEVTEEEAEEYANSIGAKLKLVSAKEDIESFNNFLYELLLDYLEKKKLKENNIININEDENKTNIKNKNKINKNKKEKSNNNININIQKKVSIKGDYNKSKLIKLQKYQSF